MNDVRKILVDTATQVFRDLCRPETISAAEQGVWPADLWETLEETGLTRVGIAEETGGSGGSLGDALAVLRIAGRFAAPVPLAETFLAGWLLTATNLPLPGGPLTIAPSPPGSRPTLARRPQGWILSGGARRVPWARDAGHCVVVGHAEDGAGFVTIVPRAALGITPGQNLAGEARDDVRFDGVRLDPAAVGSAGDETEEALWSRGALTRVVLMAGALDRLLELTVSYAGERVQFGRPIGRFQAIQQQIARLAGEVAAAGAAAEAAGEAAESGDATAEIAAAKVRVGQAAGAAAAIAHQVHGATGFTHEHSLHYSTRRLWAWRDEFGNESEWADRLGRLVAARGADALWPFVTGT